MKGILEISLPFGNFVMLPKALKPLLKHWLPCRGAFKGSFPYPVPLFYNVTHVINTQCDLTIMSFPCGKRHIYPV